MRSLTMLSPPERSMSIMMSEQQSPHNRLKGAMQIVQGATSYACALLMTKSRTVLQRPSQRRSPALHPTYAHIQREKQNNMSPDRRDPLRSDEVTKKF